MSAIFGGSKNKSTNTNKGLINTAFQPLLDQAGKSNNALTTFLSGDGSQFNKFADAAGMPFEAARGVDQIGSASSGRGVFRSGARDKAISEFGQGLSGRYAQQFIQSLLGQTGTALNAGGLVAGAGQESNSSSKPGIASFLGQAAAGVATGGTNLAPKAGSSAKSGLRNRG
jgi:hypothetical protein